MSNILALAILSLIPVSVSAVCVSQETASRIAARFVMSSPSLKMKGAASLSMSLAHTEWSEAVAGAADFYVFNATDGSAFVLVAGDDRAEAVLAYGEGSFNMDDLPCNLRWLLERYREQMECMYKTPSVALAKKTPVFVDAPVIMPMLTCNWDQRTPYRNLCPVHDGKNCVTGCVATAMAQVMYYWRYPLSTPALPSYVTRTLNIDVAALPSVEFDWDNMLDKYVTGDYTDEQATAVATLMRYCGQACKMDYGVGSSSAFVTDEVEAMKAFGYNSSITSLVRYNYSDSDWVSMMLEDLTAGRPLLYGSSGTMSHAFVIDGYDGAKFHVNWGWGGAGNGYYSLDAFPYGFSKHDMLFQVFPEGVDGVAPAWDFESGGIYYKVTGGNVRVTNGVNRYHGAVVIPESVWHGDVSYPVTTVGPGSFAGCTGLTSVVIGSSVTTICENAFADCVNLKRIAIAPSVRFVHNQAFVGCTALDTVDLSGLESWYAINFMDEEATPLRYAHHLRVNGDDITHVNIPESVVALSDYLFRNCESLVSVTMPATVKSVGRYSFYRCSSLKSVLMGDSVATLGYCAFAGCKALDSIALPASLKQIPRLAFKDCSRLTSIVIPDSVTSIGAYAFNKCTRLASVTLGEGLDTIAASAFGGCTAIASVTSKSLVPPLMLSKSCFHSSVYSSAELKVPHRALSAYRTTDYWNLFATITGIPESVVPGDVNGDGEVNIADVNALIQVILTNGEGETWDVNGDGEISVADINLLIDLILSSGR